MFNGNPIINKIQDSTTTSSQLMTVEGTIHRTGFLTLILVLSGMYSFNNITDISITWIALIVGFLLAMFASGNRYSRGDVPHALPLSTQALKGYSQIC